MAWKTIGTHSGNFHCDEVFACFMLRQLQEYSQAPIVRSRDPAILSKCDIVVDVGGIYDHSKCRYDHHQRQFAESMQSIGVLPKFSTKLSSAGLVYAHYGHRVVGSLLKIDRDSAECDILFEKMYESFVEEVDAGDNGIAAFEGTPRYRVTTTLGHRVANLNPSWNAENKDTDKQFLKAVQMVGDEFTDRLMYYKRSWLPSREIVRLAIDKRFDVDESGKIFELSNCGVPWKEHFFRFEEESEELMNHKVIYVIFSDDTNESWRVQAVPVSKLLGFETRVALPQSWRGLRDEELDSISGISGCVFCHASGFIGGNRSRSGALAMARRALELNANGNNA